MIKYNLIFKKMIGKEEIFEGLTNKELQNKIKEIVKENFNMEIKVSRNIIYSLKQGSRPVNPLLKAIFEISSYKVKKI